MISPARECWESMHQPAESRRDGTARVTIGACSYPHSNGICLPDVHMTRTATQSACWHSPESRSDAIYLAQHVSAGKACTSPPSPEGTALPIDDASSE